ncbi:MAG TPA: ABC transporter ATP-binding protein, partial [Chitinophagaceae bacterium]|nr:ABC transporter ATP-binding protein [Chitinophagaceae bacterium]
MIRGFTTRMNKLRSNLHLMRTLRLIWTVTRGRAAWTAIMILAESMLFLASLYMFRKLVDIMAHPATSTEEKMTLVIKYMVIAGAVILLYAIMRSVTTYITDVQASKITEYIDDRIHAAAAGLDLAFYESPAYFDTMKRARDAGPERPNAILTNLADIAKSGMML